MSAPAATDAPPDPDRVARVVQWLVEANSVLFITGAGISAESGLPTYRGIGGLYNDGGTEDGMPIEVALSGFMLHAKPDVCWRHIARIEAACRGARFNRAHARIAAFERAIERVWVLTQNVDGFHHDAGTRNLIEIHGRIRELVCTQCARRQIVADYSELEVPPYCPCGGLIRPDVVLFGEMLPGAAVAALDRELARGFDVVFSIGTTSVFPYIIAPVLQAAEAGKPTVEINPDTTDISGAVGVHLQTGAVAALDAVWAGFAAATGAQSTREPP